MIYMEYGQQAERLLSSQVHRSLSSLWKELLGSSIPTDKWLMTPCKWARDNLHWYISAHLKCKLCSTHRHRGLNTPQLPLSTRHNCKLNEYSIQLHPSLSMWSCLFNPCHGVYGVIPRHDTRGQCHDVTLSRVTCDDTTPGPDNPRYPGQQRAHRHKQWVESYDKQKVNSRKVFPCFPCNLLI